MVFSKILAAEVCPGWKEKYRTSQRTLLELVQGQSVALHCWGRACFWGRLSCESHTGEFTAVTCEQREGYKQECSASGMDPARRSF